MSDDYQRKYSREDVDYKTWYSEWQKRLAHNFTRAELESCLYRNRTKVRRAAYSHLRAIDATHSMSSNSTRRAHSRNVVAASGDKAIALKGALEIHDLFPEYAKQEKEKRVK